MGMGMEAAAAGGAAAARRGRAAGHGALGDWVAGGDAAWTVVPPVAPWRAPTDITITSASRCGTLATLQAVNALLCGGDAEGGAMPQLGPCVEDAVHRLGAAAA
eukprot:gene18017-3704_t